MRVFIELPTWLGDAVMAGGALNLLLSSLKLDCDFDSVFSQQSSTSKADKTSHTAPNLPQNLDISAMAKSTPHCVSHLADDKIPATAPCESYKNQTDLNSTKTQKKANTFVLFGSFVATQLYSQLSNCELATTDTSRNSRFRLLSLAHTYRSFGEFDLAFSFRSSLSSRIALRFLHAKHRFSFTPDKGVIAHQAQRYFDFIKTSLLSLQKMGFLNLNQSAFLCHSANQKAAIQSKLTSNLANSNSNILVTPQLFLPFAPYKFTRPTIGINAGASYGSAKRWLPERFADVAAGLADKFEIMLFGGKPESDICNEIEYQLAKKGIKVQNMAGKTDIAQLCSFIAGLRMFITNDSGPMHIAAVYKVPTIAIFGSTKDDETSPFNNPNARIIKLNPPLKCMPCMKRVCHLKTHECMDKITSNMVLEQTKNLIKLT